jgi:hypothetical protein
VRAHDALSVGDEITSIEGVPAAEIGVHGVQALVYEAGADPLRLEVRQGGLSLSLSLSVLCVCVYP